MYYRLCRDLSVVDDCDRCVVISELIFFVWLVARTGVNDIAVRFMDECLVCEIVIEVSEFSHRERDILADIACYAIGFDEDLILLFFIGVFWQ